MTAICQFCSAQVTGLEKADDSPEGQALSYRSLANRVWEHMMCEHRHETTAEILALSDAAGCAAAMRYVMSPHPAVDYWRAATGRALMQAFDPAPTAPVQTNLEPV